MMEIVEHADHATFINNFHCEPADQDEVVRINVDIVEQVASRFPGFVAAAVHRGSDGRLVTNYLQWETAEHLHAMQRSAEFRAVAQRLTGLVRFDAHECTVEHVAHTQRRTPARP